MSPKILEIAFSAFLGSIAIGLFSAVFLAIANAPSPGSKSPKKGRKGRDWHYDGTESSSYYLNDYGGGHHHHGDCGGFDGGGDCGGD